MDDLKAWMTEAGITDAGLAPQIGVSRVQITRIRNGSSRPSPLTAMKLEKVTGIPAAKFIFGAAA